MLLTKTMKTKQIQLSDLTHASYTQFGLGESLLNQQVRLFEPESIVVDSQVNPQVMAEEISLSSADLQNLQIGIDEAGRGPLLGSVTVGAVLLPTHLSGLFTELDLSDTEISMINDSKKISEKKRDKLFKIIPKVALAYSIVDVPASVIDEINILQASLLGMRIAGDELLQAFMQATKGGSQPAIDSQLAIDILYDGNKLPQVNERLYTNLGLDAKQVTQQAVVKGDATYSSIAAASILAKVSRDQQMYELAKRYPNYGIENHKGYPTKAHFEALQTQGVLPEHRRSFSPVKKALG